MAGHAGYQIPVPGEGRQVGKSACRISDPGGPVRGTVRKCVREKPRSEAETVTVPQTDTGRREEDSKALERTLVKELGKLTPYVRKKGCLGACRFRCVFRPQESGRSDCLLKTQVSAKSERRRIETDACPLLER